MRSKSCSVTRDGDWTTAAGDDAFSGLDPAHPKPSIQAILFNYHLVDGDRIKVDAGTYTLLTSAARCLRRLAPGHRPQPARLYRREQQEVWFCGCKATADKPLCDGTHNTL